MNFTIESDSSFSLFTDDLDPSYYSSLTIYSHPLWHDIKLWFLANWAQMYCCQISRTRNTCLYFSFVTTLYKITQSWRTVRAHNTDNCTSLVQREEYFPWALGFPNPPYLDHQGKPKLIGLAILVSRNTHGTLSWYWAQQIARVDTYTSLWSRALPLLVINLICAAT